MLRQALALLPFVAQLLNASPVNPAEESAPLGRRQAGYQNAVYFPNWAVYGRDYHVQDLPANQITTILYAFLNLRADGTVYSGDTYADYEQRYPTDSWNDEGNNAYGCVKQLYLQKQANRGFKTLLSIGGWTWSTNFPAAASTAEGRATFARSSVEFMKDWGFDGIDVDWEYPADSTEAANYVLLLQAVRDELDAYAAANTPGYHYHVSIAAPAGPQHYDILDLAGIANVVDTIYLMAYDFAGSWDTTAGHQANIYPSQDNPSSTPFSTDRAVTDYLAAGVPSSKLVLGMPIYGRAFASTDGPGNSFNGVGDGSWENGIWDYKDLPRGEVQSDDNIGATWSYDSSSRTMVSFDTPGLIRTKVDYLKEHSLAGSMFWEASGDKTGEESLIYTSYQALGSAESSQNQLDYPDSIFNNIRSGME